MATAESNCLGTDMRIKICLAVTFGVLTPIVMAGCTANSALERVQTLGKVKTGQPLPSYTGVSMTGKPMGAKPANGRFLIHLLHPQLPATCVDDECGEMGFLVRNQGGQLYGSSDRKLAGEAFDILPPPSSAKSEKYGVLIVSDPKGKVIAIYNHADRDAVRVVLSDLQNL
jgi:hypothetical protein